jgi:hypothetical protein
MHCRPRFCLLVMPFWGVVFRKCKLTNREIKWHRTGSIHYPLFLRHAKPISWVICYLFYLSLNLKAECDHIVKTMHDQLPWQNVTSKILRAVMFSFRPHLATPRDHEFSSSRWESYVTSKKKTWPGLGLPWSYLNCYIFFIHSRPRNLASVPGGLALSAGAGAAQAAA